MEGMKPTYLAKLLNIAPATLRLWAGKEFGEFLSPSAAGQNGARRTFSELDARILAWVAIMRQQNAAPNDIRLALKQAQAENWRDLPPLPRGLIGDEPVTLVPLQAVEERARGLEERFKLQITTLERDRDELKAQIAELKAEAQRERQRADNERQRADDVTARLIKLSEELAALNKQYAEFIMRQNSAPKG